MSEARTIDPIGPAPTRPDRSRARTLWTLFAFVLTFAIWAAFDYYWAGTGAEWSGFGIAGLSWRLLCVLAFIWVLSLVAAPAMSFGAVAFTVAAALPVITAATLAIGTWAPPSVEPWGYAAVAIAVLSYLALRLNAARVRSLFVCVWTAFLCATLLVLATQYVYAPTDLWYAPEEEADSAAAEIDAERVLFREPHRVDAALARVAPSSGDRPLLYFVGFAGDGDQHVFGAEVTFAAKIVDARYGTAPRSLLLVNDVDDRDSHPLATVSGLERALEGVAAKMNVERDALFLFLTSHGTSDPELAVTNGGLPLEQLTGETLKRALDRSGIRWRVIVISACFSGAFIEPLANPHTIVLTAAHAERTSFGCSDDRDLTYFGEAFFRDALPQATSLLDAFDAAKRAIAAREEAEDIGASEPQAFVGDEIAKRWAAFERTAHEGSDPS